MDKEYLIKKWLNGTLTDAETQAFKNLEEAEHYQEIIDEAKRFKGDVNSKVKPLETFEKRLTVKKDNSFQWIKIASGIAAIFVLGLVLFTFLNKNDIHTVKTDSAQIELITLPNNSIVNLNHLSELEYDSSDWNLNRSLRLKGEAYFEVAKGNPFEVSTEFGKVSVLGTKFNVLSRDNIFKVTCYEGVVEVVHQDGKIKLYEGSEFSLRSGKVRTSDVVVAEPYWLRDMSVFKNTSLNKVIEELEKQYNVSVTNNTNLNLIFTGAFEHNNLENALKAISQPLKLTYSIINEKKVIIRNE